ncbi:putative D-xylulose kinase A [Bienertia sinuspersici]
MKPNKKNTKDVNDEVEELLRAAEDATLLKLNLNSHNVHASPSDLDPDLDQRFRDLKFGSKSMSKSKAKQETVGKMLPTPKSDKVNEEVEGDDLLARFAALKASLPMPSSSSFQGVETSGTLSEDELGDGNSGGKGNIDDDDDEDEVEKVIRWAMDAARLDPSPPSDDEDSNTDNDFDGDETSDEDGENSPKKSKRKQK